MKKSEQTLEQILEQTYAKAKKLEVEFDQYLAETKDKGLIGAIKIDIDRAMARTLRMNVRLASRVTLWAIQLDRKQELKNAPKALPVYVDSISMN